MYLYVYCQGTSGRHSLGSNCPTPCGSPRSVFLDSADLDRGVAQASKDLQLDLLDAEPAADAPDRLADGAPRADAAAPLQVAAPPVASDSGIPDGKPMLVAVTLLHEDANNPRTEFPDSALEELGPETFRASIFCAPAWRTPFKARHSASCPAAREAQSRLNPRTVISACMLPFRPGNGRRRGCNRW